MLLMRHLLLAAVCCLFFSGCCSVAPCQLGWLTGAGEQCQEKKDKGPRTLMEWNIGEPDKKDEKEKDKEKDKEDAKGNGAEKNGKKENGDAKKDDPKETNGQEKEKNGKDDKEKDKEPEEDKHLELDRPHYPESSNTVGLGHVILESGYTYFSGGPFRETQTFPEAFLRIGMFAEWFEFRIGQNFTDQRPASPAAAVSGGPTFSQTGANDLYLGAKFFLTEQKGFMPESSVIFNLNVPTGDRPYTAGHAQPGINYDFSWEVIKHCLSIEGVVEVNGAVDDVGHDYEYLGMGLTSVWELTHQLEYFAECYGIFPAGAIGPLTGPQAYVVNGLVYYITNNIEVDVRVGAGLNDHSADYLAGAGFGIRF